MSVALLTACGGGDLSTPTDVLLGSTTPEALSSPDVAPNLDLSPGSVDWTMALGDGSVPRAVITVLNSGGGSLSQLATNIAYAGTPAGWLSATLKATDAPTELVLTADPLGLPVGTHVAEVTVSAAAATNSPQEIRVVLVITDPPNPGQGVLEFHPSSVAFGSTLWLQSPPDQFVWALNTGTAALVFTTARLEPSWHGLFPNSGIIHPGDSLEIRVTAFGCCFPPPPATWTGIAYFLPDVQPGAPAWQANNLGLTMDIVPLPPTLVLRPADDIEWSVDLGDVTPLRADIEASNPGGGNLTPLTRTVAYAGTPTGWLSVTHFDNQFTPSSTRLTADPTGLPVGTHVAEIEVSTPRAPNSPQEVRVVLIVKDPAPVGRGVLEFRPPSLTFETVSGVSPLDQTVWGHNTGDASLVGHVVQHSNTWHGIVPRAFAIAPGDSVQFTVNAFAPSLRPPSLWTDESVFVPEVWPDAPDWDGGSLAMTMLVTPSS